jgi:hypothetical protein
MLLRVCLNWSNEGILGPSINHQCLWVYERSSRTLNAIYASGRTAKPLLSWLDRSPEVVCHPDILLLILCERVLDREIRQRIELHSHDMDIDAMLLGMVPDRPDHTHLEEKHLTQATRRLTLTLEGVAWFLSKLDRLEETINVLARFKTLYDQYPSSIPQDDQLMAEFAERMSALRARMAGYRAHAARVQSQGQAMVQTVCISLLIAKDS